MGEVILFTSGKGGVGKTTSVANIGIALAQQDKKVVLVDLDAGLRNLDVVLGIEQRVRYHYMDVMDGICSLQQALLRDRRFPGLHILPAPATFEFPFERMGEWMTLVKLLAGQFDYCLLDCPAGIGEGFSFASQYYDCAIIVATPNIASIHDALYAKRKLHLSSKKECFLLLNQYRKSIFRREGEISLEQIQDLLELELIGNIPFDLSIGYGQNLGNPYICLARNTYNSYCNVAHSILDNLGVKEAYDAKKLCTLLFQ